MYSIFFIILDGDKIEMEIKSDVNSEIYPDEMIQKYGNDLLDMQVGESDMKVRQILMRAVEVCNFDFTNILTNNFLVLDIK